MKIAGVSMTYNDGYKLKEWYEHYLVFKKQLDVFIIVDNNSDFEYKSQLKNTFKDAIILERASNGGCTAAYNDGIKYALEKTDVDAIAIIANDMKLTPNCLESLYNYLYSDEKLGIVSSAILLKESDVIDNYGHTMNNMAVRCCDEGVNIHNVTLLKKYTDLLSGGFTMAKREFYEKAGLQDEKLFMYSDELDTTYKARAYGYKLGVIATDWVWHHHINPPMLGKRSSASRYLICRNRIYLAKKYEKIPVVIYQIFRGLIEVPGTYLYHFLRNRKVAELKDSWYSFVGGIHGLFGYMKYNKYMKF